MAPSFYHKAPMFENYQEEACSRWPRKVWILLGLLGMAVLATLASFALRQCPTAALPAQQEGCNVMGLLEHPPMGAPADLLQMKAQIAACNKTAEALMTSLKKEKAQSQVQRKDLQGKIQNLQQQLRDAHAEVEQLRKEKEDRDQRAETSSASSLAALRPLEAAALLLLALWATGREGPRIQW